MYQLNDFVLAHEYCLAISLSGNIRLVSLEKWSLMASGKLCSVTQPWNNVSAWIADCAILLLLLPEANIDRDWDVSTSLAFDGKVRSKQFTKTVLYTLSRCFYEWIRWCPWLFKRVVIPRRCFFLFWCIRHDFIHLKFKI